MTPSPLHQFYVNLIAFLGGFYCFWYLGPLQLPSDHYIPLILFVVFIGLLGASPYPVNDLSQAVVLGAGLTYGVQFTAAAAFLGVLLASFYRWFFCNGKYPLNREGSTFPQYTFFQLGLLLIPIALAAETLNWQPDPMYDLSWYDVSLRNAVIFSLLFLVTHTILRMAGLVWYKPLSQSPARYALPIFTGLGLVTLPIVFFSVFLFAFYDIVAICVLGGFCVLLSSINNLMVFWAGWNRKSG